jgi:hypothetical protein
MKPEQLMRGRCEDSSMRLKTHGKNSAIASPGYAERILPGATDQGIYPWSTVPTKIPNSTF